ncbi:hypothetical protein MRB53_002469 [Persea americana]|uniref:Uncharacterized protein n=1 Tax=Persea americana TaxID=3435 RepID=A0ACC2MVG8_PERAE|nr:hypothetical protein MRB53_002469 [Persea americana]
MGDGRLKTGAVAFSDAGVGRRKATGTEGGSGPAAPAIDPGDGDGADGKRDDSSVVWSEDLDHHSNERENADNYAWPSLAEPETLTAPTEIDDNTVGSENAASNSCRAQAVEEERGDAGSGDVVGDETPMTIDRNCIRRKPTEVCLLPPRIQLVSRFVQMKTRRNRTIIRRVTDSMSVKRRRRRGIASAQPDSRR